MKKTWKDGLLKSCQNFQRISTWSASHASDFRTCQASNAMMFQLTVCIDAMQKKKNYVLVLPWARVLLPHIRF
jgi:hypothetical protein